MTIDEVIKRIKEKMACDYNISGCDTCNISSCEDKDIVIQLAEWLEELKFIRQWKSDVMDEFCKYDCNSVGEARHNAYNKAIDDFAEKLKEMANNSSTKYIRLSEKETITTYGVEQIAEQLKAGGENESK